MATSTDRADVKVVKREYRGWPSCLAVTNGIVELIATTDVGPRLIHFGFAGGPNEFLELPEQAGTVGGAEWKMYGGHRLWHSPEANPRCVEPDNGPVAWELLPGGMRLSQPVEPWTKIEKEMTVAMTPGVAEVTVWHRLANRGAWPVELAVWALTVMAPGGVEILMQVQRDTGLLPNRMVSLWPYTRMNDRRVHWGEKYITLRQDPQAKIPFKLGLPNEDGWAAYANRGHLFVKHFQHHRGAAYPDYASSYETYTNNKILEMESLSPLVLLEPGAGVEHRETWRLYDGIPLPDDEAAIERTIRPLAEQA